MIGENFQIYSVLITGNCVCEAMPHGMIWSLVHRYRTPPPHKFPQKSLFPYEKLFLEGDTMDNA